MTLSQLLISAMALLVGSVVLGESITWRMLAGAALVAVALGLNAIAGGRARTAEAAVALVPGD
jgi:drug/metabolite transporter (DMT)-like permease